MPSGVSEQNNNWIEKEDKILLDNYNRGKPIEEIIKTLPGRTYETITWRVRKLRKQGWDIPSILWTVEEEQLLFACYEALLSPEETAKILGRTLSSVSGKVVILRKKRHPFTNLNNNITPEHLNKIRTTNKNLPNSWTKKEDKILSDGYNTGKNIEEIAKDLSKRTSSALNSRASKLGLKRLGLFWTKKEEQILIDMRTAMKSYEEIGKKLGKTHSAIGQKICKLMKKGITFPPLTGIFKRTPEHLTALHAGARRTMSPEECAQRSIISKNHFNKPEHINGECDCDKKNINPSKASLDFYEEFILTNYKDTLFEVNIYGRNVDIYLLNEDIAIEYGCLYWHGGKDITRLKKDKEKREFLLKQKIPIVYFWQEEYKSLNGTAKITEQEILARIQKAVGTKKCQGYFTY